MHTYTNKTKAKPPDAIYVVMRHQDGYSNTRSLHNKTHRRYPLISHTHARAHTHTCIHTHNVLYTVHMIESFVLHRIPNDRMHTFLALDTEYKLHS